MVSPRISVMVPSNAAISVAIYQRVLPSLSQAVSAVAQQLVIDWTEGVQRAKLWSVEKDAYASSIKWEMTGPFSAVVVSSYRYAQEIETGRPARDLKRMLDTSFKVRVNAKGKRYLIIPFRHSTPGRAAMGPSMPMHVYQQARRLAPSSVVGKTTRISGTGAFDIATKKPMTVPQNVYQWGAKLAPGSMGPNPKGKTDRFAGMYRFKVATGGNAYMTFRVMSEESKGWVIPPRPGLYIVRQAVERIQPLAEKVFKEAVTRDLGA